ncbi:MAG: class I SAM-dependent methyltransferase [Candidatus Tectimicrobiota bacterium]
MHVLHTQSQRPLAQAARLVGYASSKQYQTRGSFIFAGIPLHGAHVLEVGCGPGTWVIWAALHGAQRALGIEPEANGSTMAILSQCTRNIKSLGLEHRVESSGHMLHELSRPKRPFDVVVMYDVINHLDEPAVERLHHDPACAQRYITLLRHVYSLMQPGGWLIVADCARTNFWAQLGLRAPLAPTIEWYKHQNPPLWVPLFVQAGFQLADLRWSPLQPWPRLTANWFVQYLTCSHFVLRFRVPEPD